MLNIIGNRITVAARHAHKLIMRFFFRKAIVWIDDITLVGEQEIVSNTEWKLYKEGELPDEDGITVEKEAV